jgi:hypothetical protein
MKPGVVKEFSSHDLERRMIERRAVEAIIWGMPIVNFDLMYEGMVRLGGAANQVLYWSRLPDWKNQTLTPNPDSIYLMPFIDTKDAGPMVLEIPPADDGMIVGSVMDCWQAPLEDVGPAGMDKGQGAKYLVLPPGYTEAVPEGYMVLRSDTYQGYALLRSILNSVSDEDVAKAVEYGKRIKLYPLSQAADPPATTFIDAVDKIFDATIPYDLQYFRSLDRMVQSEPWLERDRAMIDQLKSIGIEKGNAFAPDANMVPILERAAREAKAWFDSHYEDVFSPPFYDDEKWALPVSKELVEGQQTFFTNHDSYVIDNRGLTYTYAFFSPKHLGAGQYYLMTIKDKAGQPFEGGRTYRLVVPPNAPVKQYWSATVYDRATHSLIRDQRWSSRSSQTPDLQKNDDGSVNIYFGPKAPVGKESNWVPTRPSSEFEVLFRFYGPEPPLFEKTWKLPDIERL